MNRRELLATSSSCIFLGVGGCLEGGTVSDPDEETNPKDNRDETVDAGANGVENGGDDDRIPIPKLSSIGYLRLEHQHGLHGELKQISATGPMVTDPIESGGALHVLLIDRPIEMETTDSTLTVDLRHTDADESEKQLLHLGRGTSEWGNGFTCFRPPEDGYQLDVQTEEGVYWELTVVDPAVFRTESSYEISSFNKHNEIRAIGGGNNVFGAVRLSPGMRITLTNNDSAFPLSAEAYTETGQKEVLFDETEEEGEIVATNLEGVTWFDVTHVAEDFLDDWELQMLPEP